MRPKTPNPVLTHCAIRLPRVCELTGASRATIWRLVQSDHNFPRPFKISVGITAWHEGEVVDWVKSKMAERAA